MCWVMPCGLARDNLGVADRVQQRCLAVVNVTHDRDDRRPRFQIFGLVLDLVDHLFNVGVGHAVHGVAEFFDDQLGCIGVDGLVLSDHHTHLHQRFDNIAHTLGHTVGQFGYDNGLGQVDGARDLFTLDRTTHRFLTCALLLALHRSHGPLTATFATGQGLVQRQLARAAAIVGTLVTGRALVGVAVFLAGSVRVLLRCRARRSGALRLIHVCGRLRQQRPERRRQRLRVPCALPLRPSP